MATACPSTFKLPSLIFSSYIYRVQLARNDICCAENWPPGIIKGTVLCLCFKCMVILKTGVMTLNMGLVRTTKFNGTTPFCY